MTTTVSRQKWFIIVSPILVLILTRLGIEFSIRNFKSEISWIPSFIGYYIAITIILFIASKFFSLSFRHIFSMSSQKKPKFRLLFWGIIFPALLPLAAFIPQIKFIPIEFIFYIIIFAVINPLFEEGFWRGLLFHLPGKRMFRIFYSAALFSFSHLFFWGYWFKIPMVIIPTVISTFIMGIMWMWFMEKNKNLLYPILSHFLVDIFNLSVAVYYGLIPPNHF